jgi:hypothetical protein
MSGKTKLTIIVIIISLLIFGCKANEIKADNLSVSGIGGDIPIYKWYSNESGTKKLYIFYDSSLFSYKLIITEYSNATGGFDGKETQYNNQKMTDVIYNGNNIKSFKIKGKLFYF